jgi:hypothetical protein
MIELNSPSNKSYEIWLMRRSAQSQAEFSLLFLDKSGFLSAINITFLNFRVRDKSTHERGAQ